VKGYRRAMFGLWMFYVVFLLFGLRTVGLTDDDDFYLSAGRAYADWLFDAVGFRGQAWSRTAIDAAFGQNREHPPVAKFLFGICQSLFGVLGPIDGARMGNLLLSSTIPLAIGWVSYRHLPLDRALRVTWIATLLLLFLPGFAFHARVATLDVPVATLYFLTAVLCLLGGRSLRWSVLAGVSFGLACGTKLNAPFLLLPYGVFIFVTGWMLQPRSKALKEKGMLRLPSVPLALLSLLVLGPLVFFVTWPWIWFDTLVRLQAYLQFHLQHYGIHFLYQGTLYTGDVFAPWSSPFVMMWITVPLGTSLLAGLGVACGVPKFLQSFRSQEERTNVSQPEVELWLTLVLHAAATIAVVAFSGGPKYGGVKLFMPFFPFWCFLAGLGADALYREVRGHYGPWVALGVPALPVAASLFMSLRFGGYALSEYNAAVGGLRGAAVKGYERQYYDVAFLDLVDWLNREAPADLRLHFLPNNWEYERTYRWYQQAGRLRPDIRVVQALSQASWVVLTHERRFARYAQDLGKARDWTVLREKRLDGVPLWTVLKP
jgi:hypothetical protein